MAPNRVAIDHILCPTDFSDFSARAFARAVRLGRYFDARVMALHVIPLNSPAIMISSAAAAGSVALPAHFLGEQRREAAEALRRFVAAQQAAGVNIHTALVEGEPWVQIDEMAAALPAGLVVMGTHGRSGWDRFLLGSNTEKVMRRVACPVLAVGKADAATAGPLYERILCASDLTASARHTVDLALSFAQENQARITLLHVLEGALGPAPADLHRPWQEPARGPVDLALEQLARAAWPARGFCEVRERVETGSAWREIVRVAEETAADLIVVGAHVTNSLGRMFLGSTANQVLRHAPCPVLIARETPSHAIAAEKTA
jgi:nucleotide-binding universal stress UspA family protein